MDAVRATGLDRLLSAALAPWRKKNAVHDPAKVVCDLAMTLALGGDCLADIALLRAEPGVYGPVASDPTVSRTIDALANDAPAVLAAVDAARGQARATAWWLAGRMRRTTTRTPSVLWSWTWTRPWSTRTATRRMPRRRSNDAIGFIRCGRS